MARKCYICGKGVTTGQSITRRGLAKSKGGVGKKTTGITKRTFLPNLQNKKALINGKVKKVLVCVKCIKGAKITPPSKSTQA